MALLLLAGLAQQGLRAAPEPAGESVAAKPALTVMAVQAQRTSMARQLEANGNVAAWQEAIVGAQISGLRIAQVLVNVGDVVRRGQLLASLDDAMVRAEAAQSRAALAEAEAALAEAAANAQRARDLQPSGALSAQQANQLLTAESTAQARVQAQRAALQVQQLRLAQTQVLAPDSGVISARSATVGAVVPAGMELFRLLRQGRLEWRAEVAASDLARIKVGQNVKLAAAGSPPIVGKVRMVAPTVDERTRNGIVYVDLPQPGLAKAGMFARGEFDGEAVEALTLPQTAVVLRDGFSYVFVVDPAKAVVQQRKVEVGQRVGERIAVIAGLRGDERVVLSGGAFLADGDSVRLVAGPVAVGK